MRMPVSPKILLLSTNSHTVNAPKMTMAANYQAIRYRISEDRGPNLYHCENTKYLIAS